MLNDLGRTARTSLRERATPSLLIHCLLSLQGIQQSYRGKGGGGGGGGGSQD